jgi:putative flippase GtrA
MKSKNLTRSQFIDYLKNGTITFFIYYLLIIIFIGIFRFSETNALSLAYILAIIFNFAGNRSFVFKATDGLISQQIFRFIIIALINYFIQILTIKYFYLYKGFNFYIASFIGIFIAIGIGFVTSKIWIFKKKLLT